LHCGFGAAGPRYEHLFLTTCILDCRNDTLGHVIVVRINAVDLTL
jgi:hypothetical protein